MDDIRGDIRDFDACQMHTVVLNPREAKEKEKCVASDHPSGSVPLVYEYRSLQNRASSAEVTASITLEHAQSTLRASYQCASTKRIQLWL
jgi:hypothetical protein